ncbi:hypothetical protein BJX62DRAFT_222055 [Aspergillus germanicus]
MNVYNYPQSIDIPTNQNLTELLHTTARPSSDVSRHVIFEDDLEGRSLTLEQLRDTAGKLASGLSGAFNPADQSRWAVILPNSVTIVEAVHAILWLGGVACPINHQLLPSEIAHALTVCKPTYIIAYGKIAGRVEDAISVVRQNEERDFTSPTPLGVPHYDDTRSCLATIHQSSGTTGLPKGVGLSQYNYISNVYELWKHDPERWNAEESMLCITPMVHLANGTDASSLAVDRNAPYHHKTRPTTVQMLPSILLGVLDVRKITGAHGGLKESEREALFGQGKWQSLQMYGLTEAGPWVAVQRVSDDLAVGQLGHGVDAPSGGPGELWIKGPNITEGYIDNPEANKNAFPENGWFNTGDICSISTDGIYNSFQVSPNELEVYIGRHPAAKDTELPTGYIAPTDIHEQVDRQVSGYKRLRGGVWRSLKFRAMQLQRSLGRI